MNSASPVHAAINATHRYQREPAGLDVWQTPAEFDDTGVGDCEDFAIAYWHALRDAPGRAYVAWCWRGREAHMVCLYYQPGDTDPQVLDVAVDAVCGLSERPDLRVVVRFNRDGVWLGLTPAIAAPSRLWTDVLASMNVVSEREPTP